MVPTLMYVSPYICRTSSIRFWFWTIVRFPETEEKNITSFILKKISITLFFIWICHYSSLINLWAKCTGNDLVKRCRKIVKFIKFRWKKIYFRISEERMSRKIIFVINFWNIFISSKYIQGLFDIFRSDAYSLAVNWGLDLCLKTRAVG